MKIIKRNPHTENIHQREPGRQSMLVEKVLRVKQGAPQRYIGEDGLPVPPFAVYNSGGGTPVNLIEFICTLQEEL